MAKQRLLAWHWLREDRMTRYKPQLVEVGQTLTVKGPVVLCERGLHASLRAIDSLEYAPGPIVCRVRLEGTIIAGGNKHVATKRTVIAMADATKTLGEWSCWCVEQALLGERAAGREPDPRSWAALEVKRRWLRGEATDEELDAARAAAWAAARDAARAARDAQNERLEAMLLELLGLAAADGLIEEGEVTP